MHNLEKLPYAIDALEPFISENTINFHYGKHHQTYLDNLNKLIAGTEMENMSLSDIVKESYKNSEQIAIYNNAAQVFNHNFFWRSLAPKQEENTVSENLLALINNSFGSLDAFLKEFKKVALSQFGSGWTWLVARGDKLEIIKTSNADNPLTMDLKALFTIDVWEHSYYLDYQNKRADYIDAILHNLINWQEVDSRISQD